MTVSPHARRAAAEQEDIARQWRDWCSYLRAHLALFEARSATSRSPAFEHDADAEEQASERTLAALPAPRRALFDAVRFARRQEIQAAEEAEARAAGRTRLLDPDTIEHKALKTLLDDAEGRTAGDGWGIVPLGTAAHPEWYRVDVVAITDAPSAALYALGRASAAERSRRLTILGGLVGVCAVVLIAWLIWPQSSGTNHSNDPAPVLVDHTARTTDWRPKRLTFYDGQRLLMTLPVSPTTTTQFPPTTTTDSAWWQISSIWPLRLCIPAAIPDDASEVSIISDGQAPERRYRLHDGGEQADLILESCNGQSSSSRSGTLTATFDRPTARVGQRVSLDEATSLIVRSITLTGPGEDPALPTGQARVDVEVAISSDDSNEVLDWPALAPTLLLASGDTLLPGATEPLSDGVRLRYLVPLPQTATEMAWMIQPRDAAPLRWRATLALPPSRDAVLRTALEVRGVEAGVVDESGLRLAITLVNRSPKPLQLVASDIVLTRGDAPVALPDIPQLAEALAPGETRVCELMVPVAGAGQTYTLTVGTTPFRIAVERRTAALPGSHPV